MDRKALNIVNHYITTECFDKSDEWAKEWLKTNYGEPIGENDFEIIDVVYINDWVSIIAKIKK